MGNENKRKPGSINKKGEELNTRTVIFQSGANGATGGDIRIQDKSNREDW